MRPTKGKEQGLPDVGFDGSMTLYFGGLTFVITAEGEATAPAI